MKLPTNISSAKIFDYETASEVFGFLTKARNEVDQPETKAAVRAQKIAYAAIRTQYDSS